MGGFYYQYRDKKTGKIVRKGTPGAIRVQIRYDRETQQRAGKKGANKAAEIRRQKNKRKDAAKKGKLTRELKRRGGSFRGQRKTKALNFLYRDYTIDIPDAAIIDAICQRERLEWGHTRRVMFYGWVDYRGEDGHEYRLQTKFRFADYDPTKMEADMSALTVSKSAEETGVAEIIEWGLSFTPPRE